MTRYRDLADLYQQCSPDVIQAAAERAPALFAGLTPAPAGQQVRLPAKAGKRSKFNNTRVLVDGVWYDSQAEATRWQDLLIMQRSGYIADLVYHRVFDLYAGIHMELDY